VPKLTIRALVRCQGKVTLLLTLELSLLDFLGGNILCKRVKMTLTCKDIVNPSEEELLDR